MKSNKLNFRTTKLPPNVYERYLRHQDKLPKTPSGFRYPFIHEMIVKIVYDRLVQCDWNRTHTAASLGISLRSVRDWIKRLKASGCEIKNQYNKDHTIH